MRRRDLLAGLAAAPLLRSQQASAARVEVLLGEPVGRVAPEVYGHFVEHLGGVVYDGIWVGENSKIPNKDGIRNDVVAALAKVKPAVIRWPGGCFADQYDWRDGTGPRASRPVRTNFWVDSPEWPANANKKGPQVYEPNHFGSVEFARFCRRAGAQPYFAANLRSLPAQDFWHWVEYCNSPAGSTTHANRRAADGEAEPLHVRYWGVGNESWGCGGNFSPEDYAIEYRRYSAWVPKYGQPLSLVASGPNGGDYEWTRKFFQKIGARGVGSLWGWGLHHYSWNASAGKTNDWMQGKGDALRFTEVEHYELLREATLMDGLIRNHWAAMGEVDRAHRVKLVVDEWGSWHRPGTEPFPEAFIGQQNTMRDAVLAGLTLNIFHAHAEKVAMANIAQLVNCLQSLFLVHEDKFCLTPTYHVFDQYKAHQGAESVRTMTAAPKPLGWKRPDGAEMRIEGVSASATVTGKRLTVSLVNPSFKEASEVEIRLNGARAASARGTLLAAGDPHAHNTWTAPDAVRPAALTVRAGGDTLRLALPASAVATVTVDLA